jgi:hypothetical protein
MIVYIPTRTQKLNFLLRENSVGSKLEIFGRDDELSVNWFD